LLCKAVEFFVGFFILVVAVVGLRAQAHGSGRAGFFLRPVL
jgi:hypothetical protein